MLAWMRSPRGSTTTATVAAVTLAMFWLEPWSKPLPFHLAFPSFGQGTAAPAEEPARSAVAPVAGAQPALPRPSVDTSSQVAALSPTTGKDAVLAVPVAPSFDVVRVEPDGAAVIAGRGAPNSHVVLLDGEREIADAAVNDSGEFTLLPPSLGEGNHSLSLRTEGGPSGSALSSQSVAVAVAGNGRDKPLVALMSPDQPTRVLSGAAGANPPSSTTSQAFTPVTIQSVEAAGGGTFMTSGVAKPGNQCRLYLNGAYLADVTAGSDGRWSVEIKQGMRPGRYTVRADELTPGSNAVLHRAEVPFDYPAMAELGPRKGRVELMARAKAGPPAGATEVASAGMALTSDGVTGSVPTNTAVIANVQSATVMRGDSLWRISRKMLGHGMQYTEIYASNAQQIRDPALIYPGQIFVLPKAGKR